MRLEQRLIGVCGNLFRCLVDGDEESHQHIRGVLVDDIFQLDVIPAELDDIFPELLNHARVVLEEKSCQLKQFHPGMIDTELCSLFRSICR